MSCSSTGRALLRLRKLLFALESPLGRRALRLGTTAGIEHAAAFADQSFATVVDVGANRGQFALFARMKFPQADIVAFEPLPAAADRFMSIFSQDPKVAFHRVALGAQHGRVSIHIATEDDSSSLLPIGDRQTEAFGTREIGTLEIEVRRLDELLGEHEIRNPALLKIDVQGFEAEVLRGCGKLLGHFDAVYVEASYVELYRGQALADEITELLARAGFVPVAIFNVATDSSRTPLQADFLFRNRKQRAAL